MAKVNTIQTALIAGELNPILLGRVDIPRYPNGVAIGENILVRVEGGGQRRDGTRFVASTKFVGQRSRLFRFIFNVDTAYLLEFGAGYIRFFTSDGQVILNSAGTAPLEVVTPYTETQVRELNRTQRGDTMLLFHPDVITHRLLRLSANAWSIGPAPWVAEPFAEVGHRPNARLTLSNATVGSPRTATASPTAPAVAPTIGAAFARNQGALVTFTPPTDTGGLPIDYYEVTSSPGGITATGPASPVLITGLTNGVTYSFTVKAVNSLGASPASLPSNTVVPNAAAGGTAINVNITPTNYFAELENGTRSELGPTASSPDGIAPLTFLWQLISGNGTISLSNTGANRPTVTSTGFGSTNYAIARCTIIDATGGVGSRDVNITCEHRNRREPIEGGGIPR